MNIHPCPACTSNNSPRYTEHRATHQFDWYVCSACRHAYRTLADCSGANRKVVAESPKPEASKTGPNVVLAFPSPCCGDSGRIKMTTHEPDGTWRRHVCRSCSTPYYSCVNDDGLTIMRFKKRKRALEVG